MHIKKIALVSTALGSLALGNTLAFPAYAQGFPQVGGNPQSSSTSGASSPSECVLLGIAVNFTFDGSTSANAKNELDSRFYKLNMFLLQNNIDRLETLSMSYKITQDENNKPPPRMYHVSGSAEYQINSTDGAFKIGQFLTHEKFQTTVSYKPVKPDQCNPPEVKTTPTPTPGAKPVAPLPVTGPVPATINAVGSAVSGILKQQPPGLERAVDSYHNGSAPDIPVLQYAPPETEPQR